MNWLESVRELRKIKNENRLVVFVGAGVSKNSGMPLWDELIKKIADKIHYSRCDYCKKKDTECNAIKCKRIDDYSFDDYLRIPEYFYDMDRSAGKKEYYSFIINEMNKKASSNPLDDLIVDMLPHHIITTNFDPLLEKSKSINTKRYLVVKEDKQLLSEQYDHYILKMHGSIEDKTSIVLKESDYIEYESNHPLICTMIKALLINHSFLFLGYTLNDYNLKLIMGWINYYRKLHGADGIKHYLFTTGSKNEFEEARFEESNVIVINGNEIQKEAIRQANVPADLENNIAQRMYTYLKCINDPALWDMVCGLSEIVDEVYNLYKSYNKIALKDLSNALPMGRVYLSGTALVFLDDAYYNKYKSELMINVKLRDLFRRSFITEIHCFSKIGEHYKYEDNELRIDDLFACSIMNDYIQLCHNLKKSNKENQIYYFRILGKNKEVKAELQKKEIYKDYVDYILIKMRRRIASITPYDKQKDLTEELKSIFLDKQSEYNRCVSQLEDLFSSSSSEISRMEDLLKSTEERYGIGFVGYKSGNSFIEICKLQGYAYHYLFFFRLNCLPLDPFNDPINYFTPYIKAILCSYYKCKDNNSDIAIKTDRREYVFSSIDYEIVTKYTKPQMLCDWLRQYIVYEIRFDDDLRNTCLIKFSNLCDGVVKYHNELFLRYIYSSVIILLASQMADRNKVFEIYYKTFKRLVVDHEFCEKALDILSYLLENCPEIEKSNRNKCLQFLLKDNIYSMCTSRNNWSYRYDKTIRSISKSIGSKKSNSLFLDIVSKEDFEKMYKFRALLPKNKVNAYFADNVEKYSVSQLTIMFFEERIVYNSKVERIYLESITHNKPTGNGITVLPDYFTLYLNDYLLLGLLGHDIDISAIAKYRDQSIYVRFITNPTDFDYKQVDLNDYMWQNYIYSDKYRGFFLSHKNDLVDESVRAQFASNRADSEQQKVVYGLLLDKKELRRFPN